MFNAAVISIAAGLLFVPFFCLSSFTFQLSPKITILHFYKPILWIIRLSY
ncbi:hypothetical protein MuYL_1045 [Mucilaginibacter xinganensis]|uniref:Uncharacterized protein n=1 Tax=Mucilaginibacter xinganensis TaxID=1234841 RepID=A0A223NSR4_9SPHI|nr:hypothetical protein MuYL_1045 [Mucilaginibacter xinganensis]